LEKYLKLEEFVTTLGIHIGEPPKLGSVVVRVLGKGAWLTP